MLKFVLSHTNSRVMMPLVGREIVFSKAPKIGAKFEFVYAEDNKSGFTIKQAHTSVIVDGKYLNKDTCYFRTKSGNEYVITRS